MSYPHWPVVVVGVMIGASPSTAQPIRLPTAPPLEQRNGVVDIADLPPLPLASEGPSTAGALLAATDSDEDVVVGAAKREQPCLQK